jgi:hypothetical protein
VESLERELGIVSDSSLVTRQHVHALIQGINLIPSAAHCTQKVDIAFFSAHDQVLAPDLSQTKSEESGQKKTQKGDRRRD